MPHTLFVIALFGVIFASGCSPRPPEPLTDLPEHKLELPPPPPPATEVKHVPAKLELQVPKNDPWAAKNPRAWRYIVIHHSASDFGSAEVLDAWHRTRGFDELGYHFVINNGHGGTNGLVEVGTRWTKQKWGAHTGGTPDNEYNNRGIGICLIGDFSSKPPSPAQLASLRRVTRYLSVKYDILPGNVITHREAPNANTDCPGAALQRYVERALRPELNSRFFAAK